jgi:hypothetical protein
MSYLASKVISFGEDSDLLSVCRNRISQKAAYLIEPWSEHKRLLCCSKTNSSTTNLVLNIFDKSSDQLPAHSSQQPDVSGIRRN